MGFNFPSTPTNGQEYTSGGVTYVWNGYGWDMKANDAPSDGKLYGRKNSLWAEVISDVTKSYVDTEIAKTVKKTGDTMTGALNIHVSGTGVRLRAPSYGVHLYNDDSNYYFLLTNAGNPDGTWNALRPFYFSLANGTVYMNHVVNVGSTLNVAGVANLNGAATVPTRPAESTGYVANTAYVEDRAYQHAVGQANAAANQRVYKGGDTMWGRLTASGAITAQGGVYSEVHTYGGAAGSIQIDGAGGGADSMISFHRPGAFGVNFGLRAGGSGANHLSYGGWSHGSSVFDILSTGGYMLEIMMNKIAEGIEAAEVSESRSSLRAAKTDLLDLLKLGAKHFKRVGDEEKKQRRKPNGQPYFDE